MRTAVLPDFPEPKAKANELLLKRFDQTRRSELGIFDEMQQMVLPEGDRLLFVSEDGVEREVSFVPVQAKFSIPAAELPTLTLEQVAAKIDQAAKQMAKQQHERILKEFTRAVQAVGNELDAKRQPFEPEHILKNLERLHIDFDQSGNARLPKLIVHPDMEPRAKRVLERLEMDPVLRKRLAEIIAMKREEWRARESRRKLVG